MAYSPNTWQDEIEGVQSGTLVDAAHMNHIEQGIKEAAEAASNAQTTANGKADANHNHNSSYYTKTEMNTKLNEKLDKTGGTVSGDIGIDKGTNAGQFISFRTTDTVQGNARFWCNAGNTGEACIGSYPSNASISSVLSISANKLKFSLDGTTATYKDVHHDGNSRKVVVTSDSTTAPSDTTALWIYPS